MFKPAISRFMATIFTAVLTAAFTASAFGQGDPYFAPPVNPHDFSDKYYLTHGVDFKELTNRLTGDDFLSTITPIDNVDLSDVRVLITLPAYMRDGQPVFWSPLARLAIIDGGANQDFPTIMETASRHPIYVFPEISTSPSSIFSGARQAPLMDDSLNPYIETTNPLSLRQVMSVNYTANAKTRWGVRILSSMAKVNGIAVDGGPIVRTMEDLKVLVDSELVAVSTDNTIAVGPVIENLENGSIAKDAFLSFTKLQDGSPLEAESIFITMFDCAQDKNNCSQ